MRIVQRFTTVALVATASLVSACSVVEPGVQAAPDTEWTAVGGSLANTHFSTLTQINTQTIARLGAAWRAPLEVGTATKATPVVRDGVMFLPAGRSVYALNARTGQTIWKYQPESVGTQSAAPSGAVLTGPSGFPNDKGVALGEGLVFVPLLDGRVIALNDKTGQLVWSRQMGDDSPKPGQEAFVPVYAAGLVFTGLGSGDSGLRGKFVVLDAKTGRERWHFFTLPAPGEPGHDTWDQRNDEWSRGGGGIWLAPAVDVDLGLVYFSTGNPVPQFGGELRPGTNLYTSSVLALEMTTGKLRWYYQLIHHDVWDGDTALAPVIYDANLGGRSRKLLGVMRSDGYLFVLDRETGKPAIPVEERPVRQDALAKTSATQPFPVGGENASDCEAFKGEQNVPSPFVLDCDHFRPYALDTYNVLSPRFGFRVVPLAYNPQTGYAYAHSYFAFVRRRRIASDSYFFIANGGSPRVPGLKDAALVSAIDVRSGKVVWKKHVPLLGLGRGGLLTTAGGLTFYDGADGALEALNARTGESLWRFQTDQTGGGGPAVSYEIDGDQYIAFAGTAVWAMKLDGTVKPVQPPATNGPPEIAGFDGPITDTARIETARPLPYMTPRGRASVLDEHAFNPLRARVKAGTPVQWINNGTMAHTMVAQDGAWTTGVVAPGNSVTLTFDKAGAYTYACTRHPWAVGQLIVQ